MKILRSAATILFVCVAMGATGTSGQAQSVDERVFWGIDRTFVSLYTQDGDAAHNMPVARPIPSIAIYAAPLHHENAFYVLSFLSANAVTKFDQDARPIWSVPVPFHPISDYIGGTLSVDAATDRVGFVVYRYNPNISTVVIVSAAGVVKTFPLSFQTFAFEFAADGGFYVGDLGSRIHLFDAGGTLVRSYLAGTTVQTIHRSATGLFAQKRGTGTIIRLSPDLLSTVWESAALFQWGGGTVIASDERYLWVRNHGDSRSNASIIVLDQTTGEVVGSVPFDENSLNLNYSLPMMQDGSVWSVVPPYELRQYALEPGEGVRYLGSLRTTRYEQILVALPFPVTYPDPDLDAHGDPFDNCPVNPNPGQEDRDADGSGDACQPDSRIRGVFENGGAVLEVDAVIQDPNGDALSGTVSIVCKDYLAEVSLALFAPESDCASGAYYHPHGVPGQGIGYDGITLSDIRSLGCATSIYYYEISVGACGNPEEDFYTRTDLPKGLVPPDPAYDMCVRKRSQHSERVQLNVAHRDPESVVFRPLDRTWTFGAGYSGGLPVSLTLTGVPIGDPTGRTCTLTLTTTDGTTPVVTVNREFLYQGESAIRFGSIDPAVLLPNLLADVEALGLDRGTSMALGAKLRAAQASVATGDLASALNQLRAFTNFVEAQRGKRLTNAQADALIGVARNIVQFLE